MDSRRHQHKALRVFKGKIARHSTTWLKKLRDKLWDVWTWEDDSALIEGKIKLLEIEIARRRGSEYNWETAYERQKKVSKRKRRQRLRKAERERDIQIHGWGRDR